MKGWLLGLALVLGTASGNARAAEFSFSLNAFFRQFNELASKMDLHATKDNCHDLAVGGIECMYKVNPIMMVSATGADETSPARGITMMGGVVKDQPTSALNVLSTGLIIAQLASPEVPQSARNKFMMDLMSEIAKKPSKTVSRKLGGATYEIFTFSGIFTLSVKAL